VTRYSIESPPQLIASAKRPPRSGFVQSRVVGNLLSMPRLAIGLKSSAGINDSKMLFE
jgi:hypothetical protein